MKAQFFKTPNGEEMVVLSRADYEAMIDKLSDIEEDAADLSIGLQRKADLESGKDARLPEPVSAALLRGDSLLKALRNWRDMTQMHLAHRTGLGQGYISDLEAGRRKGTAETLALIATALDIDPAWLAPNA